jgi:hypothetical protein
MENDGLTYSNCSPRLKIKKNGDKNKNDGVRLIKAYPSEDWLFYCVSEKYLVKFKVSSTLKETQYDDAFVSNAGYTIEDFAFLDEFNIGIITERIKFVIIDSYTHTKIREISCFDQPQT